MVWKSESSDVHSTFILPDTLRDKGRRGRKKKAGEEVSQGSRSMMMMMKIKMKMTLLYSCFRLLTHSTEMLPSMTSS